MHCEVVGFSPIRMVHKGGPIQSVRVQEIEDGHKNKEVQGDKGRPEETQNTVNLVLSLH